jgi:transcriptional regulator with XRE-family HTH domain
LTSLRGDGQAHCAPDRDISGSGGHMDEVLLTPVRLGFPMPKSKKRKGSRQVMPRSVDARDAEIGRHIRAQRERLRLSQSNLADRIGVTFQQVQKYENGTNRISIGRLLRIAEALSIRPALFLAPEIRAKRALSNTSTELFSATGGLRLIKAFDRFPRASTRAAFVQIAEAIAKTETSASVRRRATKAHRRRSR